MDSWYAVSERKTRTQQVEVCQPKVAHPGAQRIQKLCADDGSEEIVRGAVIYPLAAQGAEEVPAVLTVSETLSPGVPPKS